MDDLEFTVPSFVHVPRYCSFNCKWINALELPFLNVCFSVKYYILSYACEWMDLESFIFDWTCYSFKEMFGISIW